MAKARRAAGRALLLGLTSSVTTTSYHFVVLLNVAVFAVAGLFGLAFLHHNLARPALPPPVPRPASEGVALEIPQAEAVGDDGPRRGWRVGPVFYLWMVLFGLVGGQMSWVLRPFLGREGDPFVWFSPRGSSFFEAVVASLRVLFGG